MSAPTEHLRSSWIHKINITEVDGVTVPGPCWIWTGAIDKTSGYGRVQIDGRCGYLHRVTYERYIGAIPEGLHIDHLCRQRACCAPHHLEAVTCSTNVRRGTRATQTHCKNDHPLSGDNLYLSPGRLPKYKHRTCRTCRDAYVAEWRARRKQRQAGTWAAYYAEEAAAS